MKQIRYLFIIFILAGILNLFKMYNLVDFNFIKYDKIPKVEINEEVIFQTEDERVIKDINLASKNDLRKYNLTESEIRNILKYREFVGFIDDINKMKKILRISTALDLKVEDISEKTYNKYKLENLSNKNLIWLGFSQKEIMEIKKILKDKKGEKITIFDFSERVNEEILKRHIDFKEGD